MNDDKNKLLDADGISEIQKENESLQGKHNDLKKEITDKQTLMAEQIIEKAKAVGEIEG